VGREQAPARLVWCERPALARRALWLLRWRPLVGRCGRLALRDVPSGAISDERQTGGADVTEKKPEGPAAQAERKRARAAGLRASAGAHRDLGGSEHGAAHIEGRAAQLDREADHLLCPFTHATGPMHQGRGGEMIVPAHDLPTGRPDFVDTVRQRGDMLAAEASAQRMELSAEVNALTLSVDMAESIQAANSVERALAHQMAVAHKVALQLAAKADHFLGFVQAWNRTERQQVSSIEAARMATASARMMEAFGRAALTLDRLRNGGRQVVTVQHVNVADGGRAVVAGRMSTGGRSE
jgi:hypothetical protein